MTKPAYLFLALLFIFSISEPTYSQVSDSKTPPVEVKKNQQILPRSETNISTINQEPKKSLIKEINVKLTKIDDKLISLIDKKSSPDWTTLLSVVIGAIIGGALSLLIQIFQTKFEISRSLMDWKVRQLSELYGPLYALLHQSNAIYRQMNYALEGIDPNKFRVVNDTEKVDLDKQIFQIYENGQWTIFRTITHIQSAYGRGYGVECYFDEVLDVGERMVKIIEEKAGFIRDNQPELADVFGKYLAHYAVLRQLHKNVKVSLEPNKKEENHRDSTMPPINHTAAFPREIQGMVQTGYKELNAELNNWGKKGSVK